MSLLFHVSLQPENVLSLLCFNIICQSSLRGDKNRPQIQSELKNTFYLIKVSHYSVTLQLISSLQTFIEAEVKY